MHAKTSAKKAQMNLGEYGAWFLVGIFVIMLVLLYVFFRASM